MISDEELQPIMPRLPQRKRELYLPYLIAGLFWQRKGLHELADQGTRDSSRQITRRINGGYNGWEDRGPYYERARLVLSCEDAQPGDASVVRLQEPPSRRGPLEINGRTQRILAAEEGQGGEVLENRNHTETGGRPKP